MRKFVLFVVLLLPFAFAESAHLADFTQVEIIAGGKVSASGGELQNLQVNLSIPGNTGYQKVFVAEKSFTDADGNSYLKIEEARPKNPFVYSKKVLVNVSRRSTPYLPASFLSAQEYDKFTKPTARTQSGDAGISSLAQTLTENASDDFEKIARLAIYVNENMKYAPEMLGEEMDAKWVMENNAGVCVEYSTLFAALARSVGIPVRYVSGYSYSDEQGRWMGHMWAEAFAGEWVPVDATWFEVGELDAMHVEEAKFAEITNRSTLFAQVSSDRTVLSWETEGKSGAAANNIAVKQATYMEKEADFSFNAKDLQIEPGKSTIVSLEMEGNEYRAVPVLLASCTGPSSVGVEGGKQYLVLEPGKKVRVEWKITAPSGLQKNYVYSCPLTLNSPYLENRVIEVKIAEKSTGRKALEAAEAVIGKQASAAGADVEMPDVAGAAARQQPCAVALLVPLAAAFAFMRG